MREPSLQVWLRRKDREEEQTALTPDEPAEEQWPLPSRRWKLKDQTAATYNLPSQIFIFICLITLLRKK